MTDLDQTERGSFRYRLSLLLFSLPMADHMEDVQCDSGRIEM
jgi:hypothetical protein